FYESRFTLRLTFAISVWCPPASPRLRNGLDAGRVLQRTQVAEVRAEVAGADDAAHYLGVACLRDVVYEENAVGAQGFAQGGRHLLADLGAQRVALPAAGVEHGEHDHRLALQLVRDADRCRFAYRQVRHRGRLHLRRPEALPCDL